MRMISDAIIVSLITGALACVGSVVSVIMGNRLTAYRIAQLEEKVTKHNGIVERTAILERDVKTAFRLIDDLAEDLDRKTCVKCPGGTT